MKARGNGAGARTESVTIPRWIEIKDERPRAEEAEPSRMRFYVVNPKSDPEDAVLLARALANRERIERTYRILDNLVAPIALIGVVALAVVLVWQASPLWYLVIVAAYLLTHFMRNESEAEMREPFDVAALEDSLSARMFHRIAPGDYRQAGAFAAVHPERAAEVHGLLWRVYELQEVLIAAQEEVKTLSEDALDKETMRALQGRMLDLETLVTDARASFKALVEPRYHSSPQERERIRQLFRRLDITLQEEAGEVHGGDDSG